MSSRRRKWRTQMIDLVSLQTRQRLVAMRAALSDSGLGPTSPTPFTPTTQPQFSPTPVGSHSLGVARPGSRFYLRPYAARGLDGTWAASVFLPMYCRMRQLHGNDFPAIVRSLAARTGADPELGRRIALSTAVLMRAEGIEIPMPVQPTFPRPPNAESIRQPWLRALLTGWI